MKLLTLFFSVILQVPFIKGDHERWEVGHGASYPRPLPQEIMVDSINYIGLLLLHAHNEGNENNIAFSPYGAASVLVALAEGVQGAALKEIVQSTLLPLDVSATRIGLRDIHRHLKSYFIPQEGFLAGLTFSHENVTLNPPYEALLRFYGYDIDSFNNALYPDPYTTPSSSEGTASPGVFSSTTTDSSITNTGVIQNLTPTTLTIDVQPSTFGNDVSSISTSTEFPPVSFNDDGSLTIDVRPTITNNYLSDLSTESSQRATFENSQGSTPEDHQEITPEDNQEGTPEDNQESTPEKSFEAYSTLFTESRAPITGSISSSTIIDIISSTNAVSSSTTENTFSSTFETDQSTTISETTEETIYSTTGTTITTSPEVDLPLSTILSRNVDINKAIENYEVSKLQSDLQSNVELINLSNTGNSLPLRSQKMIGNNAETLNKFINVTKIHYGLQGDDETQGFVTTDFPYFSSTLGYENGGFGVNTDDYQNINSYTPSQEIYGTTDDSLSYNGQNLNYLEDNDTLSTNTEYSVTSTEGTQDSSTLYDQVTAAATSAKNESSRTARSVIDYLIAKYHDRQNKAYIPYGYQPPPPRPPHTTPDELAFSVNGKYREPNINFMTYDTVLPFRYISYLNSFALTFPLDSTKYYLLLVLPIDEMGIDQLIKDIIPVNLKQIVYNLHPTRVKAIIPSFMLKGYVVLTPTLQKLGIRQIFEPRQADFSRMTEEPDIYVTNIEQAVTVTIRNYVNPETLPNYVSRRQEAIEFKADHPFLYFVMDSEIHVALMAGKIINPLNSRIR